MMGKMDFADGSVIRCPGCREWCVDELYVLRAHIALRHGAFFVDEDMDPNADYDPGPEVYDEGGMSEFQYEERDPL